MKSNWPKCTKVKMYIHIFSNERMNVSACHHRKICYSTECTWTALHVCRTPTKDKTLNPYPVNVDHVPQHTHIQTHTQPFLTFSSFHIFLYRITASKLKCFSSHDWIILYIRSCTYMYMYMNPACRLRYKLYANVIIGSSDNCKEMELHAQWTRS